MFSSINAYCLQSTLKSMQNYIKNPPFRKLRIDLKKIEGYDSSNNNDNNYNNDNNNSIKCIILGVTISYFVCFFIRSVKNIRN
jgi:hypothetical protein